MEPLYTRVEATGEISRFIRSYHFANRPTGHWEIDAPPTGYPVLGHIYHGFEKAMVAGETQPSVPLPFNILAAPLRRKHATIVWSGGIGHAAVELTATCLWEMFHLDAQVLSNRAFWVAMIHKEIDAALSDAVARHGPVPQAFDEALTPFIKNARSVPDFLGQAIAQIEAANGIIRIGDLCRDLNTTVPTLNKWFRQVVGLPPKYFARVVQFNHLGLLILMEDNDSIAQLASEAGFSDQAHFSHVVQEFLLKSPAAFLESDYMHIGTFLRQGRAKA